jgi:nicotinate-nucleotide adenylyltransferase
VTRVALLGGSFNPPHVAHQLVALYVLETQPVDELWFVPVFAHAFGKPLEAYEHRVAMAELAAAGLGPRARVSRAEQVLARRPGFVASRTLDLVDHVVAQGLEPRLVVGADVLAETHKWHRWGDVVARAPLIVVGRAGHPVPAGSTATGVAMPEISSTRIRELCVRTSDVAVRDELAGLLPRQVLWYIDRHQLYAPQHRE